MGKRRALIAAVIVVAIAVGVSVAAHDALVGFALRRIVASLGYDLRVERIRATTSSLEAVALDVRNRAGEPVFRADRIDIGFSLRDLLPGSRHRFGLTAVDVERPWLTLIHHADGTYNVALPGGSAPPARPDNTPIDLRLRVRDGTVALIDRFVEPHHERRESLTSLAADAVLAPRDPAYYRVDAMLQDGARRYPIRGRARFDHARRFAAQHWAARELPIGPLVNFAIATHDINIVDGRLRDVDARSYGFMHDDGVTDTHLGVKADLVDGKVFVAKLRAAVGAAHGRLLVYDDGLTTSGIDATLADVPLHLSGGLYGLADPRVRFVVTGAGPLARLRTLAPQTAHVPLDGNVSFALRADGPLAKPVVRGAIRAARVTYGAYVLHDVRASLAFAGTRVDVAGLHAGYGPIALDGGGSVVLGEHALSEMVASIHGPADRIPYAAAILPGADVSGLAVLRGSDTKLAARGIARAAGPSGTLDAPFALAADGTGTVGPVALARSDGASLYARAAFDRPHGIVDVIASTHGFSLRNAAAARLPGLGNAALPALAGHLDADVVAEVRGTNLAAAAGSVHIRGAGIGGVPIGDADAQIGGDAGTLAVRGRVAANLERLTPFLGGIVAQGRIDAPIRVVANANRTVVQLAGARFTNARVGGIAISGAAATIALRGAAIDVDDARLDAAGGRIVAQGSFGGGGTVRVSASGIDAAALRAAGIPIGGGRIGAVAVVGGTAAAPRADAAITLTQGRVLGAPLAARAFVRYDHARLHVDDAAATYAGAVAAASGTVDGIGGGSAPPRLDIVASVRGADAATLARQFRLPLRYPDGRIDADVRASGAARDPSVAGDARIAVGSINGLYVRDVNVPLDGRLDALDVKGGRARVGSTLLAFDAAATRTATNVALRSDRADLADFNDYFDGADTLAGTGRVAATAEVGADVLATSGDVALREASLRRLPLGNVEARWSSRGRTVTARASVGGAHGTLRVGGTATVPARNPLAHVAASRLDLRAGLAAVDLETWLPAAGITVPLTGRVDGSATIEGRAPNYAIAANGALHDGTAGRIPIRTLTLAATYAGGRARVATLQLEALNFVATGSGTFGLGARSPLDLTLRATTPDAGELVRSATGRPLDAAGALAASLRIVGTRAAPSIALVADLDQPRYERTQARHAHADIAFAADRLVARDVSLDLQTGRIALSGSIPAQVAPPFVDRRNAPITARLLAQGVDLGQFATLLPKDTKVGGVIDGDIGVTGNASTPQLGGSLTLAKGSFVAPQVASEVRDATLALALSGRTATVRTLHASIGGGTLDGTGSASVGDLRDPARALAFTLDTRARNIGLDLPKVFRGKIDGTVTLRRDAGAPVLVGGVLDFSHTRIPLSALLPSSAAKTASAAPPPVAFDLTVNATSDNRVQSPNVDIGAKGTVLLAGTLAKPTLDGSFTATDGTLSLYRTFTLQKANVTFDPASGIIPDVDATATTQIPDPTTDVLLHAYGPATGLTLDLSSRPEYDKAQILGLLVNAQSLGAVSGVARTSPQSGGTNPLQGAAIGYIDQQFTRGLFEPFSSTLGRSLGLSTFSFNAGLSGGFAASASRSLGDKMTATFAQSSDPQQGQRQSAGLEYNFSASSAFQLTLYDAGTGARSIGVQTPFVPDGPTNFTLQALAPPPGSSGYVFSFVKKFP